MGEQTSERRLGYGPSAISGTEPYVHNAPGMVENMGLRLKQSGMRLLAGAITGGATLAGAIEPDEEGNLAERAAADANEYAAALRERAEQVGGESFVSLDTVDMRLADGDTTGLAFDVTFGALMEMGANLPEFAGMLANGPVMAASVVSYGSNLAMDRAKNDGRDTISREDMAAGMTAAVVQRYLAKAEVSIPKNILFGKGSAAAKTAASKKKGSVLRGASAIAAKGLAAGGKGAGLEAASEELDYLTAYLYTKEGVSQKGAVEAALSGALIGAGPAAIAGAAGGIRDEAQVAAMRRERNRPAEEGIPLALPSPPTLALPPPAPGLPGPDAPGGNQTSVADSNLAAVWTDALLSGDARTVANAEKYIIDAVGSERAKRIMEGGVTAPEAGADLAAQVQAVETEGYDVQGNPTGVKSAVFSETRAPLKAAIKGVDDWKIFESREGGFYAAPANSIAALRKVDRQLGAAGRPDILGYSAPKPAPGAPVAVVQGKDTAGNTVQEQVVDPTDVAATAAAVDTADVLGDTVQVTTPEAALTERQEKLAAETEAMHNPMAAAHKLIEDMQNKDSIFDGSIVQGETKEGKKNRPVFKRMDNGTARREPRLQAIGIVPRAHEVERILSAIAEPMWEAAKAGIDTAPVAKLVNALYGREVVSLRNGSTAKLKDAIRDSLLIERAENSNLTNTTISPFMSGIRQAVEEVSNTAPTRKVYAKDTKEKEGAAKTATGMPRASTPAAPPKKKAAKKQATKKKTTKKAVAKKTEAPKTKPTAMEEAMAEAKAKAEAKAAALAEKKNEPAPKTETKGEKLKTKAKVTTKKKKAGTLSLKKKAAAKAPVEKKKEVPAKAAALKKKAASKPRILKTNATDKQIGEQKERALKVLSDLGGDNVDAATRMAALVRLVPELDGLTMTQVDDLMTLVVTDSHDVSIVGEAMSAPLEALRVAYVAAHDKGTMANQARALNTKARGDKTAAKGYTKQKEDVEFLKANSTVYGEMYDLFKNIGKESLFLTAFTDAMASGSMQPLTDLVLDAAMEDAIYYDMVPGGGSVAGSMIDGLQVVTEAQIETLFNVSETLNMHLSRKGLRNATTEGEVGTKALASIEDLAEELQAAEKTDAALRAEEAEARAQQDALDTAGLTDLSEASALDQWNENDDLNDYEAQQGTFQSDSAPTGLSHAASFAITRVRHEVVGMLMRALDKYSFNGTRGDGRYSEESMRGVMELMRDQLSIDDPLRALAIRLLDEGNLDFPLRFARVEEFADLAGYPMDKARRTSGTFSWAGAQSHIDMNADRMRTNRAGFVPIIMHEIVHAFTMNMFYQAGTDTALGSTGTPAQLFAKEVAAMRGAAAQWVGENYDNVVAGLPSDAVHRLLYGLTTNGEFLAEANTNAEFQQLLSKISYEKSRNTVVPGGKNLWQVFRDAVWKVLGGDKNKDSTLLDEALLITAQNEQNSTELQEYTYFEGNAFDVSSAEGIQHVADISTGDTGWALLEALGWADKNNRRDNRQNERSRERTSEHAHRVYSSDMAAAVDEFNGAVSPDGKTLPAFISAAKKIGGKAIHLLGLATLDIIDSTYRRLFDGTGIDGGNPLQHLTKMLQARAAHAKKHERTDNYILRELKKYQKRHPEDVDKFDALWLHANHTQVNPAYAWLAPQNKMARKGRNAKRNRRVHAKLRTELQSMSGNGWMRVFKGLDTFYTSKNAEMRHETMAAALRGMGLSEITAESAAARAVKATTKEQIDAFTVHEVVDGKMQVHESIDDIRQAIRELNKATIRNGPQAPIMRDGDFVMRAERSETHVVADKEAAAELRASLGETMGVSFSKAVENANGTISFTSTEKVFELHEKASSAEASKTAFAAEGYTTMQIVPKNKFEGMDTTGFNTILNQAKKRISSRGGRGSKEAIKTLEETLSAMVAGYQISKSSIRRRNKAGGNPDQRRTLAKFIQSHSKGIAALKYGDKVANAQDDLIASGDRIAKMDTKNAMQAGYVINELNKRINGWRGERGKLAELSGKFGFGMHLMSFSYSLVNLTQHLTTGLPYLAGRHGIGKTLTAMGNAYKTVGKPVIQSVMENKGGATVWTEKGVDLEVIVDTIIGRVADPEARRMLQSLADGGVIDASFTMELYEASLGSKGAVGEFSDKVFEMGRTLPFITEIVNRTVVSLAAFELAIAKGESYQNARDYAESAVRKTQFDYTEVNRPRWFVKNDLTRVLSMFKLHPLGVYGMMVEQVNNIRDPKTRAEGARTLAYLLTTHGVFAGAAGAILMEPVRLAMAALGLAFDDDDEVQRILNNPEIAMRKFLYETTGSKMLAQVLVEGAPTALNIQMFSRVGLQNLMIQRADDSTGMDYAMDTFISTILGPTLGFGTNLQKFSSSMKNGNTLSRSMEYLAPKGVRDVMRATRYSTDGMTDFNGNVIQGAEQFGWDDMLIRAVGFSSVTESDTYAGRRYRTQYVTARREHSKRLTNAYHQASGVSKRSRLRDIRTYNRTLSRMDREEFGIDIKSLIKGKKRRVEKEQSIRHGGEYRKSMNAAEELRMLRAP